MGTNSVLLLVGRRRADGSVEVIEDRATVTRLGEGVAASGSLLPRAVARTVDVLGEYRAAAERHGADVVAVATAGLRMAGNPGAFLEPAAERLGVGVRMVDGDEEAELSYRSVAQETGGGHLRVLDIGGGSTELVIGEGMRVIERRSHPLGSVRFTERYVDRDPPGPEAVAAMEAAAREVLASQPVAPHDVLHGLAGTVTTAAALVLGLDAYDRERVDGIEVSRDRIIELRDLLARETLATRTARPVLEPGRADVVVAGTTILGAALDHCGAHTLVVRDRGLRYALI